MMRVLFLGVMLLVGLGPGGLGMVQAQGGKFLRVSVPRHVEVSGVTVDGAWERVECKARTDGRTTVLTTSVEPMWIGDVVVYESGVGGKPMTNVLLSEFPIAVDLLGENLEEQTKSEQHYLHLMCDETGQVCYLQMQDGKGGLDTQKFFEKKKDGVKGTLHIKEGRVSGQVEYRTKLSEREGDWGTQFDFKIEGKVLTLAELRDKKQKMLAQEGRGGGVVLWQDEPHALRYAVAYQESVESFGPVHETTVILLSSEPISVEAIRRGLTHKNHELHPDLRGAQVTIRLNEKGEMYALDIAKYRESDGQNQIVGAPKEFVAGRVEIVEGRVRGGIQLDAQKWNKGKYKFMDVTFDAEIVKAAGVVK